jgi:hypothetical protein
LAWVGSIRNSRKEEKSQSLRVQTKDPPLDQNIDIMKRLCGITQHPPKMSILQHRQTEAFFCIELLHVEKLQIVIQGRQSKEVCTILQSPLHPFWTISIPQSPGTGMSMPMVGSLLLHKKTLKK